MMDFWYNLPPKVPFPEEDDIVQCQGTIDAINLTHDPYEVLVDVRDNVFRLIFGKQSNGYFLCIPDWHTGCEITSFKDKERNAESITACYWISFIDALAIANVLALLKPFLK